MAKSKKVKNVKIKMIDIQVTNEADKKIIERAISLLDKAGYTLCKKNSLVLDV